VPSIQPSVADAATMAPNTPTAPAIERSNAPLDENTDASNIDDSTSGSFPKIHLYSAPVTVATVLAMIVVGL
jgi:hypothetical protein